MHLYTRFYIGKLLIVLGIFYFSIIILKIFDQWVKKLKKILIQIDLLFYKKKILKIFKKF